MNNQVIFYALHEKIEREDSEVRYRKLRGVTHCDVVRMVGSWMLKNHK